MLTENKDKNVFSPTDTLIPKGKAGCFLISNALISMHVDAMLSRKEKEVAYWAGQEVGKLPVKATMKRQSE